MRNTVMVCNAFTGSRYNFWCRSVNSGNSTNAANVNNNGNANNNDCTNTWIASPV